MSKLDLSEFLLALIISPILFLLIWGFCYEILRFRPEDVIGITMLMFSFILSNLLGVAACKIARKYI